MGRQFLITLLCVVASVGDLAAEERLAPLDAAVESVMKKQAIVGTAVGVIRDGKMLHLRGYGLADREKMIPVTPETMFRWASVSKPVTAVAAMQLWEKGKLDLDADVRTYVPEFPDPGSKITTHDLLCHQSGIVHYSGVVKDSQVYSVKNPFEDVVVALDTFKKSPLVHPPREKYTYSTHAYILLSAVVQRAGQQKFIDQVNERIRKPAGMTTMQPDYQWVDIPNRTKGYRKVKDEIVPSTDTDVSWKLGGGGFISTVGDMAAFGQALIDGTLVKSATRDKMWTAVPVNGKNAQYGLGFVVGIDKNGNRTVSHSGSQEKTKTVLYLIPGKKLVVAVMCNSEYANPVDVATAVFGALSK